jgi:lipocalin-like protein
LISYIAVPDQGEAVYIMGAGYFAYYGYYSVDAKAATVTHHIELCSERSLAGASNLRHIALDDPCSVGTASRISDNSRSSGEMPEWPKGAPC